MGGMVVERPRKRCYTSRSSLLVAVVASILVPFQPVFASPLFEGSIDTERLFQLGDDPDQSIPGGQWVRVNPSSHLFEDEMGRTRIFHGMNAVFKEAPFYPIYSGFDPEESLGEEDAANLALWGFNVVRLGVLWPGVEPQQGSYNQTYLDAVGDIVTILARHGIYTLVDFHQDLLARQFCGEGIPSWAEAILVDMIPQDTRTFPWPVAGEFNPEGEGGEEEEKVEKDPPSWDQCLSNSFLKYYFTAQVGAGFQALYDNGGGLMDAILDYWRVVARQFADNPWVIGYDLMNEPWLGDVYRRPRLLAQPGFAENVNLQPMYKGMHAAIREEDDRHILFYEGFAWSYWSSGFTETPGGSGYEDRDTLSYHMYCILSDAGVASMACDPMNSQYFLMRRTDVERLGGGSFLTEFGAVPNSEDHIRQINQILGGADEFLTSWAYWSFKDYHDVTTINGGQQSLYESYSTPVPEKLAALSRTYAQAVAGKPLSMSFDPGTKIFRLEFVPMFDVEEEKRKSLQARRGWGRRPQQSREEDSSTSVIYLNYDIHYPDGFNVRIEPTQSAFLVGDATRPRTAGTSGAWDENWGVRGSASPGKAAPSSSCGVGNHVFIVNGQQSEQETGSITVYITPCKAESDGVMSPCLCRRGARHSMVDRGLFEPTNLASERVR